MTSSSGITMRSERGFTMIELMLAMVFIAFMLVFMTLTTVQMTRIYNKGVAIKSINQTGRQMIDELRHTLRYSGATPDSLLAQQRLCTGIYSYMWNTEEQLVTLNQAVGSTVVNRYNDTPAQPVRLVRMMDPARSMCSGGGTTTFDRSAVTELLAPQVGVVAIRLGASSIAELSDIEVILGTSGGNRAWIPAGNTTPTCQDRDAAGQPINSDNDFCAFGSFASAIYSPEI